MVSGAQTIEVGSEYRCRMNCSGSKVGSRWARKESGARVKRDEVKFPVEFQVSY